jgi:hypothetical protein
MGIVFFIYTQAWQTAKYPPEPNQRLCTFMALLSISSCSYPHLLLTIFTDLMLAPGINGLQGETLNPTKLRGLVWCGMWVW